MSGTDYTLTTNYGLYKPLPNADINQWGSHLNLNADTLDGLLHTSLSAGPFLPLSGGTVSGNVSIGSAQPNYVAIAGGASGVPARIVTVGPWADLQFLPQADGKLYFTMSRTYPAASSALEMCRFDYSIAGTNSGQSYCAEVHAIDSDTVTGSGVGYFNFLGGPHAGATGGRTAFGVNFAQGGTTNVGQGNFYVGGAIFATAAYNGGGTSSLTCGALMASNDVVLLGAGATWWEELCGYELDVGAAAGSSYSYKHGMKVNLWSTDAVAGRVGKDSAYSTSAMTTTAAGWDVGFAFGDGYGYWPMKATGTLIGTVAGATSGPWSAAWGINFNNVTFSGGLICGPGFLVDGSGHTSPLLTNAANDAAAATAGVPVGAMYRNGNAVQVRLT